MSSIVSNLARKLSSGKDVFLVEWEGGRIPHGAIIKDQEVTWTQHGIVYTTTKDGYGKEIGFYERIIDDLTRQPQVMLIFAQKREEATDDS